MAFLTDRTLATGVTLQDLIHIVITGDTSQNPAGSSYKTTIQQVSDAILFGFTGSTDYYVTGGTYSGGTLVLDRQNGSVTITGFTTGSTDYYVTGGTYSGGTLVLDRQNGSVTITGFTTGSTQLYEVGSGVGSTQRIGVSADASGDYSLVGGGTGNTSSGNYSFVGGGFCNTASNSYSTVVGGGQNRSIGCSSTVNGGLQNTASCNYSFVGGGSINKSICNYSTVIGGSGNTASNLYSFVGGGQCNTASGIHSVVVGGEQNKATSFCSFVGGGGQNTALGFRTTIAGGRSNTTSSTYSIIGGGWGNKAICATSVIGGGRFNAACGDISSILGGINNTSISNYGTILGGSGNTVNHEMSATYGKDVISVSACTFHVNYLALQNVPETDSTNDNMLVRDVSTGVIKQRDITSTLNKNYASFYDTGDQTGLANTVLTMSANTSDSWNTGIILSANTIFVIQNPGVYNLAFSAQMVKTGGNSSTHAHIWLYQNGLDVLYSASQIGFPSNSIYIVPAWNFFFSTTTPNEYVELKWEINSNVDNQLLLKHQPATGSVPAIPSLIVTINQVN